MKGPDADAAFASGMALLELRDHLEQAEAAFREGLELDPEHAGCLLQLGVTLRVQGRLKEASLALKRAKERSPDAPEVHLQLGNLYRRQDHFEEALQAYDEALRLRPGHVHTRARRAVTLHDLRRWIEAGEAFEALLAELPSSLAEDYELHRYTREVAEALARMEAFGVDASLPSQRRALELYRLANRRFEQGDLDGAVSAYEEAAHLKPDYADPAFPIGATLPAYLAQRPSGAFPSCRWIEEALHFHENHLGFCCIQHGQRKGWADVGPYHGGPVPIDYVLARRLQLTRENQCGVDNACRGCHQLERRPWPRPEHLVRILIINSYALCNMRCDYCSLSYGTEARPAYYYMVEPGIDDLLAKGWLAPDSYVAWGGGEPGVSREFERVTAKLLAAGCNLNIHTNATRPVPMLLEALRQGRCEMVISPDSGTPETFYRVKFMRDRPVELHGEPAFEVVWNVIGRYVEAAPFSVVLKYIFSATNLAEADIQGFLDRCVSHGVTRIMLSPESGEVHGGAVPSTVWQAIRSTQERARARGLMVLFNPLDPRTPGIPEDIQAWWKAPGTARPPVPGLETFARLWHLGVAPSD